jgi:ABC-2 type transport system permease protein
VSTAGTLAWFARHESRLAWRDWLSMMTAGRRRRVSTVAIVLAVFIAFMHFVAYAMVASLATAGADPDKATLVLITGSVALSFLLMVSQGMESVTRAFYARSDLDLVLSSPTKARKLFAVRIGMMALSVTLMALLLASPFINVLTFLGGPRWLTAYGVVAAMGAGATALAVAATIALFRTIGPKRARFVAQIVAAVIGAAFVIGLQIAAIVSYGTPSRLAFLESDAVLALAPAARSIVWWPARAILGDMTALAVVLGLAVILLGVCVTVFSAKFGDHATAAAGAAHAATRQSTRERGFRHASPSQMLRRKEWTLLRRDPWLMSQTLMQLLYLAPPAVFLWHGFGEGARTIVLVVPLLVMAAGQLAGGLAWLAISGEDAPDLVATAPVRAGHVVRAKVEAVMGVIAAVFVPFVAALALASPFVALVGAIGIVVAALSATQVQLWFRAQAKRSQFRRRQTSSRAATFAEAFSSIAWAATAALAAAGTWLALFPAVVAVAVLAGARLMRPPA